MTEEKETGFKGMWLWVWRICAIGYITAMGVAIVYFFKKTFL